MTDKNDQIVSFNNLTKLNLGDLRHRRLHRFSEAHNLTLGCTSYIYLDSILIPSLLMIIFKKIKAAFTVLFNNILNVTTSYLFRDYKIKSGKNYAQSAIF